MQRFSHSHSEHAWSRRHGAARSISTEEWLRRRRETIGRLQAAGACRHDVADVIEEWGRAAV